MFEFWADLCLCLGAWKASVIMHNYMAANIFRNPMRFFDATPIGRILSRFSSDVEVVDQLYQQLSDTIYCFMDVRVFLIIIMFFLMLFRYVFFLCSLFSFDLLSTYIVYFGKRSTLQNHNNYINLAKWRTRKDFE